ncbi:hypothetical protein SAMN05444278_11045 [Psychroflexus salarius]|uniref:Uncharacterized protein n=1 Tax=Psychroflexus salarius TaxID=1155689 RepID=A0A1M4XSZ8_9FLAO|nr:hypothetical protein SAMN05444278_11045 [Psychroflexus salarius]
MSLVVLKLSTNFILYTKKISLRFKYSTEPLLNEVKTTQKLFNRLILHRKLVRKK